MDIIDTRIQEYLLGAIPERDPILSEMEAVASRRDFPIVGPLVGRLLYVLAASANARTIFELGSGFGYSAYWFALSAPSGVTIVCTDRSQENIDLARGFFARAGLAGRVDFRCGNGLEILKEEKQEFDVIFNDIDKKDYPKVPAVALGKLRKGGLLITDNALWSGRILDTEVDENSAGVLAYNKLIHTTPGWFSTIIPLRDGVAVSVKLQ